MLHARTIATSAGALRLTESEGPGLPILMLHGTGSCRAVFGKQLNSALALQHRLIAVDLPGHGESEDAADPATYSLRGMTRTMTQLVEQLELERFMVLGWSLGGHIAIEMIEHPRLAGLMLCGAPPVAHGTLAMLRAFRPSWDMPLASKEDYTDRDVARFFALCYGRGATPELLDAIRRADGRVRAATVRSMMRGECLDQRPHAHPVDATVRQRDHAREPRAARQADVDVAARLVRSVIADLWTTPVLWTSRGCPSAPAG